MRKCLIGYYKELKKLLI